MQTYYIAIAKNVLRENRRDRQKRPILIGNASQQSSDVLGHLWPPEQAQADRELAEFIEAAKSALSAKQREAFELVHVRGLSALEAAKLSDCSPHQLLGRLCCARKTLRQKLERVLPQDLL